MNTNIRDSVGDPRQGAANRDEDVRTLQGLLNVQIVKDHRSDRFLAVDGRSAAQLSGQSSSSSGGTAFLGTD